ncbi:MAG: hypothetical protein SGI92_26215 [Bryobacteraceae bacterium]|nr:hypothetical protein [Bryobacteraceae bacterium]
MPELVTIPISLFDLVIDYEHPSFRILPDRGTILQGVFDSLNPWEPSIEDMEFVTNGKPSEQGIEMRLPKKGISFYFGPALCRFRRENADWHSADETLSILDTVVSSLVNLSGVKTGRQSATFSMHVQPRNVSFVEILRPLVAEQLVALQASPITTMAAVLKWKDRRVTLDGSGSLANGIFLRLERVFPSSATYSEIAEQLRNDQTAVFDMLGIQEDQG